MLVAWTVGHDVSLIFSALFCDQMTHLSCQNLCFQFLSCCLQGLLAARAGPLAGRLAEHPLTGLGFHHPIATWFRQKMPGKPQTSLPWFRTWDIHTSSIHFPHVFWWPFKCQCQNMLCGPGYQFWHPPFSNTPIWRLRSTIFRPAEVDYLQSLKHCLVFTIQILLRELLFFFIFIIFLFSIAFVYQSWHLLQRRRHRATHWGGRHPPTWATALGSG